MSNSLRGMIAGFIATVILTVVMQFKSSMGLWPEMNLIHLLINLGSITTVQAWMDHFIIGVVVWGIFMGTLDGAYPAGPHWLKGLIVGVVAWVIMMVAFMPLAKAGFFGSKLGPMGAVITLGYHVLYGLVLGVCYGLLTMWAPAKTQS